MRMHTEHSTFMYSTYRVPNQYIRMKCPSMHVHRVFYMHVHTECSTCMYIQSVLHACTYRVLYMYVHRVFYMHVHRVFYMHVHRVFYMHVHTECSTCMYLQNALILTSCSKYLKQFKVTLTYFFSAIHNICCQDKIKAMKAHKKKQQQQQQQLIGGLKQDKKYTLVQ